MYWRKIYVCTAVRTLDRTICLVIRYWFAETYLPSPLLPLPPLTPDIPDTYGIQIYSSIDTTVRGEGGGRSLSCCQADSVSIVPFSPSSSAAAGPSQNMKHYSNTSMTPLNWYIQSHEELCDMTHPPPPPRLL